MLFNCFFTLAPSKVKDLSQELVAVATFSSNFYYLFTQNYFSSTAEETIFLHTWSLAVEEQFYIFFPLLLLFIRTKYQRLVVISFLTIASLFSAIYFSFNNPSLNFYFTPSRIWELMAGSLVAIYYPILAGINLKTRNRLSVIGLATIGVSVCVFTKETQHPGWPTIIPILAVCIVIGCSNGTSVSRILDIKPIRFIGLISYSLYLWHQPVMAFLSIKFYNLPHTETLILATMVTGILSYFTFKFVETPFRHFSFNTTRLFF
ncbi:acyltransferase [Psychrosphaera sp. G1-22]|uniref:Acyltransferase n=1 Tax=Psychrosphaera algicola TaxID=3023714 RepID=A0ABT5FFC5_9GAMM|nr:acyltransferase [Psychrosphaera sp. G1-22]MDC2890036.1 acyltransferase [Psychrosphaera sp. G1-22]